MEDDAQKADKSTQDHWIFQHAATWPDVIRGNKESDRPSWHYIDFPLYLELADEAAFAKKLPANIATDYPGTVPREQYNVLQAIEDCRISLRGKAGPEVKSVAYCWLFHLAGDIHQPLHSTALFNVKRFPKGDHGGNDILVTRGENLHSMWDGFLGRQYYMRSVDKAVAELSDRTLYGDIWDSASRESDPRKWADESHSLCKSFVYSDSILGALHNSQPGKKMTPVELSEAYVKEAGEQSRRRVIAAGIRLATMLRGLQLESGIAPGRM